MEFNHPMHHCINQRHFSNSLTIFPKKISVQRPDICLFMCHWARKHIYAEGIMWNSTFSPLRVNDMLQPIYLKCSSVSGTVITNLNQPNTQVSISSTTIEQSCTITHINYLYDSIFRYSAPHKNRCVTTLIVVREAQVCSCTQLNTPTACWLVQRASQETQTQALQIKTTDACMKSKTCTNAYGIWNFVSSNPSFGTEAETSNMEFCQKE